MSTRAYRRYARKSEVLNIYYRVVDPENDLQDFADFYSASTINISPGGLLIRSSEPIPIYTPIEIKFTLKPFGREFHLFGHVVRQEVIEQSALCYLAIAFSSVSEADKKVMMEYVQETTKN